MDEFTHKGWLWFCPIYLAAHGDDATIEARYWWLDWLVPVVITLEASRIWLTSALVPDYQPTFMFRITGEL